MIEKNIKIHDKYQFEIKLNYKLESDKSFVDYNIETYIFIPNNLYINKSTYSRADFYNDIQTYIRFKTPTVLLKNIVSGSDNPVDKLSNSIQILVAKPDEKARVNVEYQIKLFCCIVKSSLREHVNFIIKQDNPADLEYLLAEYLESVKGIAVKYRDLRHRINEPFLEASFSKYLFGDEYISLLIEAYTFGLLDKLANKAFPAQETYRERLLDLIKSEIDYRKVNKYPSTLSKGSDNEEFIFRRGVLKKFMSSVLFLDTRTAKEGLLLEQVLFGIAAGISMIFATSVAFYSQYKFGNLSLPLLFALVLSYMFKDRIKEVLRLYFSKVANNRLFDHKMKILTSAKDQIGYSRESFDFLKKSKIPDQVDKIRSRDHITEIENGWVGEQVILYRKRIRIFPQMLRQIFHNYDLEGINDIVRFNISKFLNKMDNPRKSLSLLDGDNYYKILGERVYHLNLVIKYVMEAKTKYERFRIVLNRDGIKRIEVV